MLQPRSVEYEIPFDVGLTLGAHPDWAVEEKIDGVRALAEFGVLRCEERGLNAPGEVPESWCRQVIDGELTADGYHVFDVLFFNGEDIRGWPLHERNIVLRSLVLPPWCRHVARGKDPGEFLEAVVRDGGEGVVLKRLSEDYRNSSWVKVKRVTTEDAVILEVHESKCSVSLGQWHGSQLVRCGLLYIGSRWTQARPGQVVEVVVRGRHLSGEFCGAQFVRFRPDKPARQCRLR